MVSKNIMSYLKTPNLLKILEKIEPISRVVTNFFDFFLELLGSFFMTFVLSDFPGTFWCPEKNG